MYASPLPIRIRFDPVGRTEMSPSIWQNYFSQDRAHLYPAYKHENQTPSGFGLVCATVMHRSIGHVDFPKF